MVQQDEAFVESTNAEGPNCEILMHDNDSKF
jgi:hypothetical protein